MILSVPYVSQEGVGADQFRNDCGPACVSMVIEYLTGRKVSPDVLARKTKLPQNKDKGLNAADLLVLLGAERVRASARHSLTLQTLKAEIDTGRPVILLVNYKYFGGMPFGHFALLIGYEGNEYVFHDPYKGGPNYRISADQLLKALTDIKAFAYFVSQGVLLN